MNRSLLTLTLTLGLAGAVQAQDPRVGLKPGRTDAGEAAWNLRLLSHSPATGPFAQSINSDIGFMGKYAIQGSFNGFQVWDISDPAKPALRKGYHCPASQSDVSVYRNLLFVSGEDYGARLDCGPTPVRDSVSTERLRGIRIFDVSDLDNPKNVANVQTCRGSHTHSVLVDPKDAENIYVYVSGSAPVRSPTELAGCTQENPETDPSSALMRLEIIKVPVAHPEQAA
ncbi:MAG: LVIVD repeat-containing protein, partial [Gemmatimonadales bacterium]